MKNYIGYIILVMIIALQICGSCNNAVEEEEPKAVEIDSFALRDSIRQSYVLNLKEKESIDFILDSVKLRYSVDGNHIINKSVVLEVYRFDDIYTDNNGIHLVIYDYDKYIDLICTPEQLDSLKNIEDEPEFKASNNSSFFLTFKPTYVRKINLEYVSNNNSDDDPETEDESFIEVNKYAHKFKIKGSLINFNIFNNE